MTRVLIVAALGALTLACEDEGNPAEPTEPVVADFATSGSGSNRPAPRKPQPDEPPGTPEGPAVPPLELLREVVYVLMKDRRGGDWMCTGTLLSARVVVTAAHCLDPSTFRSFEVVAPLVEGAPRTPASAPELFSSRYRDVAQPDIGVLRLDEPIELETYAVPTNVVGRVEQGEKLEAVAIVRTAEELEAPFEVEAGLALQSTRAFGYTNGLASRLFTKGGDSGAGVFLVENGRATHKLVGVVRDPEPARNIDHFTGISAEVSSWLSARAD